MGVRAAQNCLTKYGNIRPRFWNSEEGKMLSGKSVSVWSTFIGCVELGVAVTGVVLLGSGPASADSSGPPSTATAAAERAPSYELALEAAEAAKVACAGLHVSVAVVDSAGELKILLAADGTPPIFTDLAWRKARTAAHFGVSSAVTAEKSKSDPLVFYQLSSGLYSYYGGGLPLKSGSEVIGGIAVSGAANAEGDEACAKAGLERIKARIR